MLLSTAYFPPVEYIALIARDFTLSLDGVNPSIVEVEACENYVKQSWRNRAMICTASGPETISVPIVHNSQHIPIRELLIDWSTPWLVRTKRTIDSAYHSSAWFDYYRDELYEILDRHHEHLFDLNMDILQHLLRRCMVSAEISLTKEYVPAGEAIDDYRETIHPKRQNSVLEDLGLKKPYFQVFSRKYGFVSNLSVIDLLFNEGPDSILYLKKL